MRLCFTRKLLPEIFDGEATHWQHPRPRNIIKKCNMSMGSGVVRI